TALADVERHAVDAVEAIDAGALGQSFERVGRELRRQARNLEEPAHHRRDLLRIAIAIDRLHETPDGARVAQGRMAAGARRRLQRVWPRSAVIGKTWSRSAVIGKKSLLQPVASDERVEAVAGRLGIQ